MDRKSKEFQDLKDEWYGKLKDEGFNDIEQDEQNLKQWASSAFKHNYDKAIFEAREIYYRLAGRFLYDNEFCNEYEKFIWTHHSQGISIRNIIKLLKSKKAKGASLLKVNQVIKKLAKKMLEENAK